MLRRVISSLILISVTCLPALGQESLTLMTYNIKYDDKNDPSNNWEIRKPWVIGLIKFHAPAIFGVQEALHNQVSDIKEGLPGFTYAGVGRDDGDKAGEYSPVFYDSTRFRLLSSGTFWLSETPMTVSKGWDAALPRVCTYVQLQDTDGSRLVVYNAHFDHIGVEARRMSVGVIGEHMNKFFPGETIVFMGDLNFTDDDPAYETVRSLGFIDTRDHVQPYGPKATFNAFSWEQIPENRIDYIFLRGSASVKSFAVLTDSRYNRYPSDHFPVLMRCMLD